MADEKAPKNRALQTKPASAYDVARLAGVSQSAVSRTYTAGASVSEATREKVMEAARALKYRPSHMASSLKTRRSYIIGLAVTHIDNQFYPPIIEKLSEALRLAGYRMLLFVTHGDTNFDPALDELLRYRVDGLILASTSLSAALADECKAASVPVVMLNNVDDQHAIPSVAGDNRTGGRKIAEFLHAGEHKRFGFIAGVDSSSTSREREAGFNSFFLEMGLPAPLRAVSDFRPDRGMEAARELLRLPAPPDALFCVNDQMAMAAIEVARHEFGRAIGEDISIIGFDDTRLSAWPNYALTTYSQPTDPLVQQTVALLNQAMDDPDASARHIVVPGELIIRRSARIPAHWT